MFESKHHRLLPADAFVRRMFGVLLLTLAVISVALAIGVLGYHHLAGFSWIDSILNASMILGGMGPVDQLPSDAAKIFASVYALFSGVVFISAMAVVLSPALHRALHKFHLESERKKDRD